MKGDHAGNKPEQHIMENEVSRRKQRGVYKQ